MDRGTIHERCYADLIGRPYEVGARGPDRYDCAGVVEEVLARFLGDRPRFAFDPDAPPIGWCIVSRTLGALRAGLVVVTGADAGRLHVWLALDPTRCVTALRGLGVRIVPARMILRREDERIVGVYEWAPTRGAAPCP